MLDPTEVFIEIVVILTCVGLILSLVFGRVEIPIQIRIVTSSEWTTLRLVRGYGLLRLVSVEITASEDAEVAEFDGEFLRLTQLCDQAEDCKVVEMVAKMLLIKRNFFFRLAFALTLDWERKVRFEIERGHWGWTHVQLSNCLGEEPIVVENFWWCGITPGERNFHTVKTPARMLFNILPSNPRPSLDVTTLYGKVLFGYQGWFGCPGDGSDVNSWVHWFKANAPAPDGSNLTIDFWPDISEIEHTDGFKTDITFPDGSKGKVFSSYKKSTVLRHFWWMKTYELDGVFSQRFVVNLNDPRFFCFRNKVLQNVRLGAERNGRVFALMYDITGAIGPTDRIISDWKFLVDVLKITESPNYLWHKGKPVLGIWGIGFRGISSSNNYMTSSMAADLVRWLHEEADEKYRTTIVAGVPYVWEWIALNDSTWSDVFSSVDILSPWTVGRYENEFEIDSYKGTIRAQRWLLEASGQDLMPVVWPGFSWHNLKRNRDGTHFPLNQIKRDGGNFYWRQVENAIWAGARMLYVAMFDEVDEGTAMFKLVAKAEDLPATVPLVSLDIDGYDLPSHHYLELGRLTGKKVRREI